LIKRSISIFPQFENSGPIHELRKKYDPLHNLIPPHITLVFPFISNITTEELTMHMKCVLAGEKPFSIKLTGITGERDSYLFLNVKEGNDGIIRLHDKLYSGLLTEFLFRKVSYNPHLTVGRISDEVQFENALNVTEGFNEVFTTTVSQIVSEVIDEEGRSHPEIHWNLG
jgi:2'-5' RNA ligase